MRIATVQISMRWFAFVLAISIAAVSAADQTVRIVTYNIEDDIGGFSTPRPGLIQPADSSGNATGSVTDGGVLEGIGEQKLGANNNVQPLDIVALEETHSNTTTLDPIVAGLNSYYDTPGMYARGTVQAGQNGSSTGGNGPNGIIYNSLTLQLVNEHTGPTPTGSGLTDNGMSRQFMRYEFAPAGVTPNATNEFYVYVSHYKASTGATNEAARAKEAAAIRLDSASLPATARVLYVGDYNVTNSGEAGYQTIISPGINQGVDPFNTSGSTTINFGANSNLNTKTESSTSLHYRDDLLIMTNNVFSDTAGGLQYVPNTYHTFGNDGSTGYESSTNQVSNTALNGLVADGGTLVSSNALKNDLTWAADHLPVVADFLLPVPEPSTMILAALGGAFLAFRGAKTVRKNRRQDS